MQIRWAILATAVLAAGAGGAEDNAVCFSCHGQRGGEAPHVDEAAFAASIHGRNLCISCHKDVTDVPHAEHLKPVQCANCHRLETEVYLNSDHGKALSAGIASAATCTSCHGRTHTLLSSRNPRSPVHRRNIAQTCARCHADTERMAQFKLTQKAPFDTYEHSVHGEAFRSGRINAATCPDCHGTHDLLSAANPASKVYRSNVPKTCGRCHENVREVYDRSVHGKAIAAGIREAPVCTDCHGEHTIRPVRDPASLVYRGAITRTCASCHDSERIIAKFGLPADRLKTFQDSYHGLAARWGDLRAANCASCHGWHDILPAADRLSSVNPLNLPMTCGKCHPGAQVKLVKGAIHGGARVDEHWLIRFVRTFYAFLIPLVIGGMVLHNLVDYMRKAVARVRRPPDHASGERMTRHERVQHGVLLLTFTLLAYSGFALTYPQAWWGWPFIVAGGEAARKTVHRWTALVFVLGGIWHAAYMLGTVRGRTLLRRELWPRLNDALDPLRLLGYNLGLRRERPDLPHPSYIEKAEYWALIWGSLVMTATGALLVFNDFTLKHFPLWVTTLATTLHFLEALLAVLAVLVWHGYWTMFDPDVYPMNWTWLTGRTTLKAGPPEVPEDRAES